MTTSIDPTTTSAWSALSAHHKSLTPNLRAWFAADPERAQKLSFTADELHVDLSKNLITSETVELLLKLAEEVKLEQAREAMFSGEHINVTEDRAVLHTALRRPATDSLTVDGQDAIADVHEVLEKIYAFARRVRPGAWVGISG